MTTLKINKNFSVYKTDIGDGVFDGNPELKKLLLEFMDKNQDGGETALKVVEQTFKVWKTIKLGTHKDTNALCKALKANGNTISGWANDILGKPAFTIATAEEEIQLVNVSVTDLGFRTGANYKAVCERAKKLGLELCPNEVGPQLRLQYQDQPKDEYLRIAMEAIADSVGRLRIFRVGHDDDGLWLNGIGYDDLSWDGDSDFVFRLRK